MRLLLLFDHLPTDVVRFDIGAMLGARDVARAALAATALPAQAALLRALLKSGDEHAADGPLDDAETVPAR